jgi:predicted negative regulator of RcsB-dependent stress response
VTRAGALGAALVAGSLAGCAYYNEMWSAERFARDARRYEARGVEGEARLSWARAAAKAESVLVHHPKSRWADDALVLQGVGLARSGACNAAYQPLSQVLSKVSDVALRERAEIAAATCALEHGAPREAERLLAPVRDSRDAGRRSQAALLTGQAALARGDPAAAAAAFAASREPEAAPGRVQALAAAGRLPEAMTVIDSVAARDDDADRWGLAVQEVARSGGPAAGADALDTLLARGRLRVADRARLLIADGDRLRHVRDFARALTRYDAAARLVPDSAEAGRAAVHALLIQAARATSDSDLAAITLALRDLLGGLAGPAVSEARDLLTLLAAVRPVDAAEMPAFRGAELARDSLEAPGLAANLFLRFAADYPSSLFAPKALIAVAQLEADSLDFVRRTLQDHYPASPYTLAFHGEASPAFQTVEDSLAVAFGVSQRALRVAAGALGGARFAPPRPGPPGPSLDASVLGASSAAGTPGPVRPGPRTPKLRPEDRP